MKQSPVGVILLNMGGPDTLSDVPSFLYNLFSDRDIIQLGPQFMQKPLAWLISRRRAPKSKKIYAKIGGGSPLRSITEAQARAVQSKLSSNGSYLTTVAMRYWHPTAENAITSLLEQGARQFVALSLYPHYTKATTGSSLRDLRAAHQKLAPEIELLEISSWPDHPLYIQALANKINEAKKQFEGEPFQLLYSAHSLPVSFIEQGDPYVDEIQRTIKALETATGIAGRVCYQSRSGPVEWLSPSTSDMITTLADEGCRNILMVPISFVSDHVETLYEIKMLFTEQAESLGMRLIPANSLNTDPLFIESLENLVKEKVEQAS